MVKQAAPSVREQHTAPAGKKGSYRDSTEGRAVARTRLFVEMRVVFCTARPRDQKG